MTQNLRQTPLTCSGHTRPVVFLSFSEFNPEDEANYYSISACKGIEKKHRFSYWENPHKGQSESAVALTGCSVDPL